MRTWLFAPFVRLDRRVRVAATLLRAAPRAERRVVAGMALTSTAAAFPIAGAWYPLVAVPALLGLAALIRHHLDGLDGRREALAAAGAGPADILVIQIVPAVAAAGLGVLIGFAATVGRGRFVPTAYTLAPLAAALVAALLIRRSWFGAPALTAGALAALGSAGTAFGLHAVHSRPSTWSTAWPAVLAAGTTLVVAQTAIVKQTEIRSLIHRSGA